MRAIMLAQGLAQRQAENTGRLRWLRSSPEDQQRPTHSLTAPQLPQTTTLCMSSPSAKHVFCPASTARMAYTTLYRPIPYATLCHPMPPYIPPYTLIHLSIQPTFQDGICSSCSQTFKRIHSNGWTPTQVRITGTGRHVSWHMGRSQVPPGQAIQQLRVAWPLRLVRVGNASYPIAMVLIAQVIRGEETQMRALAAGPLPCGAPAPSCLLQGLLQ